MAEQVEKSHDFEREIKSKKEAEKQKIIREIKERLSFLNDENGNPRVMLDNANIASHFQLGNSNNAAINMNINPNSMNSSSGMSLGNPMQLVRWIKKSDNNSNLER